jgi:hypothetical protein
MHNSFLYLRTKLSLHNYFERPLEHFAEHVPMNNVETSRGGSFEMLHFERETWTNGLVFRLNFRPSIQEFVLNAARALEPFESWALIDSNGEHLEPTNIGLFSSFMSKAREHPILKIFALDDDLGLIDKVFDRIKESLGNGERVFHLDDGRVMFVPVADARFNGPSKIRIGTRTPSQIRHYRC